MRADHVTFRADTEELAFYGVQVKARVDIVGENLVQRALEPSPGRQAVDRRVLVAVRNPDVGDTLRAQLAAELLADFAAGYGMIHPEAALAVVRARKGEAVSRQRMGEEGT